MHTFSLDAEEFHYKDGVLTFHLTNGDKVTTDGKVEVRVLGRYACFDGEALGILWGYSEPPAPRYGLDFEINAHVTPADDSSLFTVHQHTENWGK